MTTYEISPRVKNRWFKENELVYDLIKYSDNFGEKEVKTEEIIFTSKDLEQVVIIKNKLNYENK